MEAASSCRHLLVFALLVLQLQPSLSVGNYYVDSNAIDGEGCGSKSNPCASIAGALREGGPSPSMVIRLFPGVYKGVKNTGLFLNSTKLSLLGLADPDQVVIDCAFETFGFAVHPKAAVGPFIVSTLSFFGCTSALSFENITTLKVQNCLFKACGRSSSMGGSLALSYTTASLLNCTFLDSSASEAGGAISAISSNVIIKYCTFTNSTAYAGAGGALFAKSSEIVLDNVSFVNNSAWEGGAACVVGNAYTGSLSIQNCTFIGNFARKSGGALYSFLLSAPVFLHKSFFLENMVEGQETCYAGSCTAVGGAIAVNDMGFNVSNCVFRSNSAITTDYQMAYGGAIYSHSYIDARSEITDTEFQGNFAAGTNGADGGAICTSRVSLLISRCRFVGNYLKSSSQFSQQLVRGGAVIIKNTHSAQISHSNFTSNFVLGGIGGAVAVMDESHCTVTSSVFLYNVAFSSFSFKGQGGALAVITQSVLLLANSKCDHNSARPRYITADSDNAWTYSGEGGAMFVQSAHCSVESTQFTNNTALAGEFDPGSRGGAVALENVEIAYFFRVVFSHNIAVGRSSSSGTPGGSGQGGAMNSKFANPVIVMCDFYSNFVSSGGSGFGSGGAISLAFMQSTTILKSSECGSGVIPSTCRETCWKTSTSVQHENDVLSEMILERKAHTWFNLSEIRSIITNRALVDASKTRRIPPEFPRKHPDGVYYTVDAPTILLCNFKGNGAFGESTDVVIHRAGLGGAVSVVQARAYINDTTFEENIAHTTAKGIVSSLGGGLYANYYSEIVGKNVTFTRNVAYHGWGDDIMTVSTSTSIYKDLKISMLYPKFEVASYDERSQVASKTLSTFETLLYSITCYWTQYLTVAELRSQNANVFIEVEMDALPRRKLSPETFRRVADVTDDLITDDFLIDLSLDTHASVFVMGGIVTLVEPCIILDSVTVSSNSMFIYIGNFLSALMTSSVSVTPVKAALFLIGDLPSGVFDITALNSNITVIDSKRLQTGIDFRQLRLFNSTLFISSNITVLAPEPTNTCLLIGSTINGRFLHLLAANRLLESAILATLMKAGLEAEASSNKVSVERPPTITYDCDMLIGSKIAADAKITTIVKQARTSVTLMGVKLFVTSSVYLSRPSNTTNNLRIDLQFGGQLHIGSNARLYVSGPTFVTSTAQHADAIINDGQIQVGQQSSYLIVHGNIVQIKGSIKIVIGSLPWQGPYIFMNSNTSLGGTINITFDANNFLGMDRFNDLSESDIWSWDIIEFATTRPSGTGTSLEKALIIAPGGIEMAPKYTSRTGHSVLEATQVTNVQCEVVARYVKTGGTSRGTLCPTCLMNSSCVYCNNLCLTKGESSGQCGDSFKYTRNCCPQDCNGAGECNNNECDCNLLYTGSDCGNLSLDGAFLISAGFSFILFCILTVRYYYHSRHHREKVVNTTLDQLRQGLLGEECKEKAFFTRNYLEDLQQELILRDVLVDFSQIEVEDKIGEGAFGEVFKATFRGAQVAVKMIKTHMFMEITDADVEQIRKEAYLMSRLRHPNIVLIMGISVQKRIVILPEHLDGDPHLKGRERRTLAIITEYLNQGSLADIVHGKNSIDSSMWDYELLLSCALQAARGMLYLHSHHPPICHRDLKSSNLIVDDHWVVKVTDFGMSRIMPEEVLHKPSNAYKASSQSSSHNLLGGFNTSPVSKPSPYPFEEVFESQSTYSQRYTSKQPEEEHPRSTSCLSVTSSANSSDGRANDADMMNPMYRNLITNSTMMTSNLGTTSWCAPEMFAKDPLTNYSLKVDIYSFGMVLYELWERQVPFSEYTSGFDIVDAIRAGRRPQISHDCPAPLRSLIQRCWHQKADKRPTFQYIVRYLKDELGRIRRGTREPVVTLPCHINSKNPKDKHERETTNAKSKSKTQDVFKPMDRTSWGLYNWRRWGGQVSSSDTNPRYLDKADPSSRITLAHPEKLPRFVSDEISSAIEDRSSSFRQASVTSLLNDFEQAPNRKSV